MSLPCYILIFAIGVICIINIIQSTTSELKKRKSEIGLLKAVGYKDRQILFCLCYEQLSLTIKGFVIGGGLSAVFIAVANFINYHRTFNDRLYIVNWSDYFMFLSIAFAVAVIVPLLCRLITIHKLSKIQPKDVMN
ncbi:FtsX-like permease family protein [Ruminococcus sp.]|uniref:FtsX-like permease family protein n=1 Tax=Ruminococcus sp. TaxID=41978 RepID=UPI003F11EB58